MEYVNLAYVVVKNGEQESGKITAAKERILFDPRSFLSEHEHLAIFVDYDFNLIDRAYNYWAAKEASKRIVPCRRIAPVAEGAEFPPRIQLELTSVCNIQCLMCPTSEQFLRPRKHMEWDIFKKSVDEIAKFGVKQLQLFHIGESLLHPRFFQMMDYLRQFDTIGAKWLSTNGVLLSEEMMYKLLSSPIDFLNISLNSPDKETYSKLCPGSDYERVVRNLLAAIEIKKKSGKRKPTIRIQMIDQPLTRHQLLDFLAYWGSRADMLSINRLEAFAGQVSKNLSYSKQRLNRHEAQKDCKRLGRGDF